MTTVSMENYDQIQIMNYTDKEFFLLLCRTYTTKSEMKWVTPLWQLCMWIERQSFIHWKPPDGSSITRFIKSLTNDAVINSISMTENQRWNLSQTCGLIFLRHLLIFSMHTQTLLKYTTCKKYLDIQKNAPLLKEVTK